MFDQITALGYGLVTFAIVIGVGSVVLFNFGATLAECGGVTGCGAAGTYNVTGVCSNATAANCGTPGGTAYSNTNYLLTELGQSGLAGWTPAIIALSIGILFLGAFLVRGGSKKGRY